jgi:hypothetical protein
VIDVLDVAMRKRLPFYCCFLPLLLGAGAWWFVSWITTPRPLWVRSFHVSDFVVPIKPVERQAIEVEIEEIGKRLRDILNFTIAQDRLCIRLNRSDGYQEQVDIDTGRTVSSSQLDKHINHSKELLPTAIAFTFGQETKVFDQHIVETGISSPHEILPAAWARALFDRQLLPEWSMEWNSWLRLRDRQSGQILVTTKTKGRIDFFLTDRSFISIVDEHLHGNGYRVQAFAMPISYWSPWWGPGVGLIVTLAFWFMFKRRQPLQG